MGHIDMKKRLADAFEESLQSGLELSQIEQVCRSYQIQHHKPLWLRRFLVFVLPIAIGILGLVAYEELALEEWDCIFDQNELTMEITRPLFDCRLCENLYSMPVTASMNVDDFQRFHAYTGVPVVVQGGAKQWSAITAFSVKFFKELYSSDPKYIDMVNEQCQFLPYFTKWQTLGEALNMSDEQAAMNGSRWYIGWSNCVQEIEEILRSYYTKPMFLPRAAGTVHNDWIFMGGSGPGAPSHIDNVGRPSWQAQLRGRKTWTLEPPPECDHVCRPLSVVMNSSDIIVLDTDKWYHSTYIHPGEISITIGSEYD